MCVSHQKKEIKIPEGRRLFVALLAVHGLTQGGTATEAEGIGEGENQKATQLQ